jgi:O-antigen ligase
MILTKNKELPNSFFKANQKYLNLFTFFSIFPFIKIAGISITFFLFLIIAYIFLKNNKKLFRITSYTDIFLLLFLFFIFVSAILTEDSYDGRSMFSVMKLTLQYVYWVVLALFIKTWIYRFDYLSLSKTIFYATVVSIIYYATLNPFYHVFYPNSIAYTIVVAVPLSYYYMSQKFSLKTILIISLFFSIGMLFSGSRTGSALLLVELTLLITLGHSNLKKFTYILLVLSIPTIMMLSMSITEADISKFKYDIADNIEVISPKIAHTLRMKENLMVRDKSMLIRLVQVQKGEQIFEQHPFFGVGIGNYTHYNVKLDIMSVSHWLRDDQARENRRSSQNTYLKIIAESGIFAIVTLLVVFILIFLKGFYSLFDLTKSKERTIFIPFTALIFYGFILVTIQGALFWLLLGLSLTLNNKRNNL